MKRSLATVLGCVSAGIAALVTGVLYYTFFGKSNNPPGDSNDSSSSNLNPLDTKEDKSTDNNHLHDSVPHNTIEPELTGNDQSSRYQIKQLSKKLCTDADLQDLNKKLSNLTPLNLPANEGIKIKISPMIQSGLGRLGGKKLMRQRFENYNEITESDVDEFTSELYTRVHEFFGDSCFPNVDEMMENLKSNLQTRASRSIPKDTPDRIKNTDNLVKELEPYTEHLRPYFVMYHSWLQQCEKLGMSYLTYFNSLLKDTSSPISELDKPKQEMLSKAMSDTVTNMPNPPWGKVADYISNIRTMHGGTGWKSTNGKYEFFKIISFMCDNDMLDSDIHRTIYNIFKNRRTGECFHTLEEAINVLQEAFGIYLYGNEEGEEDIEPADIVKEFLLEYKISNPDKDQVDILELSNHFEKELGNLGAKILKTIINDLSDVKINYSELYKLTDYINAGKEDYTPFDERLTTFLEEANGLCSEGDDSQESRKAIEALLNWKDGKSNLTREELKKLVYAADDSTMTESRPGIYEIVGLEESGESETTPRVKVLKTLIPFYLRENGLITMQALSGFAGQ